MLTWRHVQSLRAPTNFKVKIGPPEGDGETLGVSHLCDSVMNAPPARTSHLPCICAVVTSIPGMVLASHYKYCGKLPGPTHFPRYPHEAGLAVVQLHHDRVVGKSPFLYFATRLTGGLDPESLQDQKFLLVISQIRTDGAVLDSLLDRTLNSCSVLRLVLRLSWFDWISAAKSPPGQSKVSFHLDECPTFCCCLCSDWLYVS